MKLNTLIFLTLLFSGSMAFSQQKGIVSGVVVDASLNKETMPAVSVAVQGTKLGANTDIDGKFKLELNPGRHILVFSYIGYKTLLDTIDIKAGNNINLNVAMASDAQVLDDVVITGEVRKDTESALLRKQMNAAVITQSIGSQEMSRKGISNAAVAITKVTGIAKQEGTSGVFVRGLGDRYNSTQLNGLPLPSNEAISKNISLDLFTTDIIQSIGISKIYTVDNYGDMGGALVDITSKEHIGRPELSVELGGGLNSGAFRSNFKKADNFSRLGFYNVNTPKSTSEYTFDNKWSPNSTNRPFNYDFKVSGGKSFLLSEESQINLFATASHTNGFAYREGFEKVVGATENALNFNYPDVKKYSYTTNTTGVLNLNYRINALNMLKLNSVFINGSLSSVNEYNNYQPRDQDLQFARQTLTEQNQLFLNQLLGEHKLNDRLTLNWAGSYAIVKADMPDRIRNLLYLGNDNQYRFISAQTSQNRYFQYIDEKEWAARASLSYKFLPQPSGEYLADLRFGYTGRVKKRDFEATQLNAYIPQSTILGNPDNIDAFLNRDNFATSRQDNKFYIITARGGADMTPFTYNANLDVHGAYANFQHSPNKKLTYTIGIRADKVLQKLDWNTNVDLPNINFDDATIDKVFILPEATLKYGMMENQNIRVAASKTYTLPQFLEKAPFLFEDVTMNTRGNATLNPAENYNLDLKWEQFPSANELFSIGIFGKYIKDPISQTLLNSAASNTFTFVNAGDYAYVFGAEIEARKDLAKNFSGGINLTYMYTRQELDPEKVREQSNGGSPSVNFNTDHDRLQGASPVLANIDITYKGTKGKFKPMISLVGNYFYDRIFSLGAFNRGNIVEKGFPTLNLVSGTDIDERFHIDFKIGNIFNNRIRMEQENEDSFVEVYSYKRGVDFSLGLKYNIINKK